MDDLQFIFRSAFGLVVDDFLQKNVANKYIVFYFDYTAFYQRWSLVW